MNGTELNKVRLNFARLGESALNHVGLPSGKSGGSSGGDSYILNGAILLKNGKPLLLVDGTPLVLLPKSENPELDASLVDAWIFSGYKNEDAPETIAGVNGIELTCNNFAWNEEGSGFKDGALWFDGVDDYLHSSDTPILDDYTIICKRNIMRIGWFGCIATKRFKGQMGGNNGDLFVFEENNTGGIVESPIVTTSKGVRNIIQDIPLSISYQTKNSYNGFELEFNDDYNSSGKVLYIGCKESTQFISKLSLNYFALYSRSLTESEIQSEIAKLEAMWNKRLKNN